MCGRSWTGGGRCVCVGGSSKFAQNLVPVVRFHNPQLSVARTREADPSATSRLVLHPIDTDKSPIELDVRGLSVDDIVAKLQVEVAA